jgi:tRNA(Ile)-lysidine synthase
MKLVTAIESAFLAALRPHLASNDCSGADGTGFLVAISGGLDSSALLRLALATAQQHGQRIAAGHVNHGVRVDADAEEARLRNLCRDLGVPFRCARLRLRGARTHGDAHARRTPSEDAMRRARDAALRRLADAAGCGWILLGHQMDDQAETLLLNLLRGAGLRGLAGMPRRRGIVLRPLLGISRSSLHSYMEAIDAPWVEDPTNLDLGITRNRIRHRILPLLEAELQPRAAEAIARAAGHLQLALGALEAQADACLAACALPSDEDDIRLDPVRLRSHHRGLIEFTLRQAVARIRGSMADIPAPLSTSIVDLCLEGRSGRFHLPGGATVEATDRWIRVGKNTGGGKGSRGPAARDGDPVSGSPARRATLPAGSSSIPRSGTLSWGEGRIRSRTIEPGRAALLRVRGLARVQVFDASEVRFPVALRSPKGGDRIAMEDGQGSRSLSDLLSERGVPRSLRADQPVLEDAAGILWAPGIRRAARAMVGEGTRRFWIVRWFGRLPSERGLKGGTSRE